MIGCGNGHLDLEFVCGCLPNITKLTAVEPDADQMAELKTRVAQLLPAVATNFYQETAQSWKGADEPFDAVLLFHCLYCVPLSERPAIYKKLFDNIVANDGLVFIMISPFNSEKPTSLIRLCSLLSIPANDIDGIQIRHMMTSAGFRHCCQLLMIGQMDVEELDDDFLDLFVFWGRGTSSRKEVCNAAEEVFGSEKTVPHEIWLGVFRKL